MNELEQVVRDIKFNKKQAIEKFNIEEAIAKMLLNKNKKEKEDEANQSVEVDAQGLPVVGNSLIDKNAAIEAEAQGYPQI